MTKTLTLDNKIKESERLFGKSCFIEAEKLVNEVLENDPQNIDALNNKRVILDALNSASGAKESFNKALNLRRGDDTTIKNLLDISLKNGGVVDFLNTYRKHRFFLTPDAGIAYDEIVNDIEVKCDTVGDEDILKELAIIGFQQGKPNAIQKLTKVFQQNPDDHEIAKCVILSFLYFDNFRIDLNAFKSILDEDEYLEFVTCKNRSLSPILTKNINILKCVICDSVSMSLTNGGSVIKCNACGKEYNVLKGVPVLLPKNYDEYRHIEPEYQSAFKNSKFKIWTEPNNRNFCVLANQLYSKCVPYDNKALLKNKYYKIVHWNNLLHCFKNYIAKFDNARILDVGSSLGHDVYALSRLYPEFDFFGVDIVLDGCVNAQKFRGNQRNQFVCADASNKLPFADNSFEFVFSINAIEHTRKNMMDEIYRILKPNGRVFIAGPSQKSYIFLSPESIGSYVNSVNVNKFLNTHGLSPDEFMAMFSKYKILSHKSDNFFFRWVLENPCISQMNFDAAGRIYNEFCSVVGRALDADPDAKWYNYIQMFVLSK